MKRKEKGRGHIKQLLRRRSSQNSELGFVPLHGSGGAVIIILFRIGEINVGLSCINKRTGQHVVGITIIKRGTHLNGVISGILEE